MAAVEVEPLQAADLPLVWVGLELVTVHCTTMVAVSSPVVPPELLIQVAAEAEEGMETVTAAQAMRVVLGSSLLSCNSSLIFVVHY